MECRDGKSLFPRISTARSCNVQPSSEPLVRNAECSLFRSSSPTMFLLIPLALLLIVQKNFLTFASFLLFSPVWMRFSHHPFMILCICQFSPFLLPVYLEVLHSKRFMYRFPLIFWCFCYASELQRLKFKRSMLARRCLINESFENVAHVFLLGSFWGWLIEFSVAAKLNFQK